MSNNFRCLQKLAMKYSEKSMQHLSTPTWLVAYSFQFGGRLTPVTWSHWPWHPLKSKAAPNLNRNLHWGITLATCPPQSRKLKRNPRLFSSKGGHIPFWSFDSRESASIFPINQISLPAKERFSDLKFQGASSARSRPQAMNKNLFINSEYLSERLVIPFCHTNSSQSRVHSTKQN